MPVADYFSPDYASARVQFRSHAQRASASLHTYELPGRRGPGDDVLAIDVAQLGAATPDRALVVVSGTHGVEGFAGSGCQVGFLADRLHEALPASACALLVHALNPYGFAWLRRVNEDGVDLNRNFVDFSRPRPSSTAYEPLHDSLVPIDWQGDGRRQADAALQAMMTREGLRRFQEALTVGQYTRPTGLFYGGTAPTWSARTLADILAQRLPAAIRRVAVLDLHTGLGPPAYGEPILIAHGTAERERARRWYGPEVRDLAADESVSAQVVGSVGDGVAAALKDRDVTYVGLEFGTRPMLEVLTALRADHWLHAHGAAAEPSLRASIQQQMRAAFYIESPAWQAAVYGRVADFVFRACRGLAEA
jgi:hypothetical protein